MTLGHSTGSLATRAEKRKSGLNFTILGVGYTSCLPSKTHPKCSRKTPRTKDGLPHFKFSPRKLTGLSASFSSQHCQPHHEEVTDMTQDITSRVRFCHKRMILPVLLPVNWKTNVAVQTARIIHPRTNSFSSQRPASASCSSVATMGHRTWSVSPFLFSLRLTEILSSS